MAFRTATFDPRYFQIIFLSIFLCYGLVQLEWKADLLHYFVSIGGCLFFNYLGESYTLKKLLPITGKSGFARWGLSAMISALSLCLLLKTNDWYISLLATFLTVSSKYILRIGSKHIFNPSAFGIVATILLTKNAWLSPGQWGNEAILFFAVITLGTIVVTRVQKLDVSLAFLFTFVGLLFFRQVIVLSWPGDYFLHSVSTGSLLLFTFFMISDPRTSPNHATARIVWAVAIAGISFYLAAFQYKNNTAIWVLVFAAPLVPLLDRIFTSKSFQWKNSNTQNSIHSIKPTIMKSNFKKHLATLLVAACITSQSFAFCGFYVSKADGTLQNKTSQVIMVRDGNQNVITMYNDFKGNFKDFAMVVPVPVVLQKSDIKVVSQQIFATLNDYSKPRLVQYYDQNPCNQPALDEVVVIGYGNSRKKSMSSSESKSLADNKVKIEAQYLVGEYDILILSAKESTGLRTWLNENGYKIPDGANEVLEPYIKSNLKFFVVKVNETELKKLQGNFLRPIQISFNSPKFMLPIRLGMANANGDQDMLVYAFTKKGRIECTNYRTVAMPTGNQIPLFVQNNFGNFYSNLFSHQWKNEKKSVALLEYAWDVSPKNFVKCDPCVATAPSAQDLLQAGVWWINRNWNDYSDVYGEGDYSDDVFFTRLHVRYNRNSFPQDLAFQVTPNKENFQARYVITHPASGDFSCEEGKKYLKELKIRRQNEMQNLVTLTGKNYGDWDVVMTDQDSDLPEDASYKTMAMETKSSNNNHQKIVLASLGLLGIVSLIGLGRKSL